MDAADLKTSLSFVDGKTKYNYPDHNGNSYAIYLVSKYLINGNQSKYSFYPSQALNKQNLVLGFNVRYFSDFTSDHFPS